ncbi:uncharacterized protein Dwil_GK27785 [Drosophila willistoni]|uniref:GOLD domain-containing protein n=1 Tax=Drosophila willistoni TaxID=7260 RepID=A0A0Q9WYF2_DROWI|nr:transmembrane emp24 domain-containing protein 2 [Drosophila willistoni]KRF98168.1 uncharacterized protein Dwil_GK27785 [Drosophila willistoni]
MLAVSLLIIVLLFIRVSGGFLITVDAHETSCFFDHAQEHDKITISFEVMEGGFKDIGVHITAPNDDRLHHSDKESLGSYTFTAIRDGDYTLCFDNEISTLTPKVVVFQFHVARPLHYYANPNERHDDVLEHAGVQSMINELGAKFGTVKQEQEYMHYRYNGHKAVSESAQFRFVLWSIFTPSLIVIMTIVEVYYLKRFFEVKRVV